MEIVSRKEAVALGLKRFFTGKPCNNDHLADRLTSSGGCVECTRAKRPELDANRREHLNKQAREYRKENSEKLRAWDRERNAKRRNPRTKKPPINERRQMYYQANAETVRAKAKEYYIANREVRMAAHRKYTEANLDKIKAKRRDAYRENPSIIAMLATRRATKKMATPPWFGEFDRFALVEAFSLTRLRRAATGLPWAVDHSLPLVSSVVCGLHVSANWQVIPHYLNSRKSNRLILTEPFEWLSHL